ncbi:hypothetical protein JCM4914_40990 [Streptomyces platensis subsp. malvinus]
MSLPGTFQVDIEELGRISRKLDESVAGMHTVTQRMDQATTGQLGHESLDSACGEFQTKWNYGIGQIAKLANSIRGSIDATAHSYRTCEMGIQQALSKGTESGAPGSSPAPSTSSSTSAVFG